MKHVNLDAYDEVVKQFILSLPPDSGGTVLEMGGRPVARFLPMTVVADDNWSVSQDTRRCELIDREIAGTLTPEEAVELWTLQAAMLRHRRSVAPLPLDDTRRLHKELLAKATAESNA